MATFGRTIAVHVLWRGKANNCRDQRSEHNACKPTIEVIQLVVCCKLGDTHVVVDDHLSSVYTWRSPRPHVIALCRFVKKLVTLMASQLVHQVAREVAHARCDSIWLSDHAELGGKNPRFLACSEQKFSDWIKDNLGIVAAISRSNSGGTHSLRITMAFISKDFRGCTGFVDGSAKEVCQKSQA